MTDEMVLVPRAELLAWAKAWLNVYDPNDGTDCVTPFDTYLLKSPVEAQGDGEMLRADLVYYVARCGDIYVSGTEAGGTKWIAVTRRELEGDPAEAQAQGGGEVLGYVRRAAIQTLRADDEVTGVMVHIDPPTDSVPVYLAPPSAPVGVELSALRAQEWLHREHDILRPVQEIEQAMRTPCSCPDTERDLAQQPAAVDGADAKDAEVSALRAEREVIGAEALKYAIKSGRLEAKVDRLEAALRELVSAADDFTAHTDDEDEIGYRPCCCVLSHTPHEDDCAVTKARAVLHEHEQEKNNE